MSLNDGDLSTLALLECPSIFHRPCPDLLRHGFLSLSPFTSEMLDNRDTCTQSKKAGAYVFSPSLFAPRTER